MSDKPKDSSMKGLRWFILACAIVFLFWLLFLWIVPDLLTDDRRNELAAIAGPLESLFAGLAFAGVIIAILQQREELALQRDELRQTREEMERSTKALTEQVQLMARTAEITESTAKIMLSQTDEMQRATYAAAFKTVFDILQAQEVREARWFVINHLAREKLEFWGEFQTTPAEKVMYTYDAVGVMLQNKMLPVAVVVDHWGDSLRKCWPILEAYVNQQRQERDAPELYNDFQWLAEEAGAKSIDLGQ